MDNNLLSMKNRRAVAPIIATLILVAIAVVGGVMIFVFAQDFFGGESMSGPGNIDTISLGGYDLRNVNALPLTAHSGQDIPCLACVQAGDNLSSATDLGAIYIKNNGGADVTITKLVIAGTNYSLNPALPANIASGQFAVYNETLDGTAVVFDPNSTIAGGDGGTIVFGAGDTVANGRTIGVTITTATGQEFNFNVVVGQTA